MSDEAVEMNAMVRSLFMLFAVFSILGSYVFISYHIHSLIRHIHLKYPSEWEKIGSPIYCGLSHAGSVLKFINFSNAILKQTPAWLRDDKVATSKIFIIRLAIAAVVCGAFIVLGFSFWLL